MPAASPRRMWVIGLSNCLTSWVAHGVAASRTWRYVDSDQTLADLSGLPALALMRRDKSFRHEWSSCYVRYVTSIPGPIVASIPGTVADHADDMHLLAATGRLIYVRCSDEMLEAQVTGNPQQQRSAAQVHAWVAATFERRDQRLLAAANATVDASLPWSDVISAVLDVTRAACAA